MSPLLAAWAHCLFMTLTNMRKKWGRGPMISECL